MCFCLLVQFGASQALCLRGAQINGEKLLRAHGLAARLGALGRKADAPGALIQEHTGRERALDAVLF